MKNLRKYGDPPYNIAVLHGGPGAPGQMAPVARELSIERGVLEPLQTATSLEGQIQELRSILEKNGNLPLTLIGSSWGAMLGFIFTSYHPEYVKKLILIGSGVYESKYAENIMALRLKRLDEIEQVEAKEIIEKLSYPDIKDKDELLRQLGLLVTKADAYDPLTLETEVIETQFEVFTAVWDEVLNMRSSGELLNLGEKIKCPVVAIHGDYDPHPIEGVEKPLSGELDDFKFIRLKNCGHLPWIEKEAKTKFYEILKKELFEE